MTDDLVAQLRDSVEEWDGCAGPLATLAADRIEKLEQALRLWACDCETPCTKGRCEAYQAKITLEEKPNV